MQMQVVLTGSAQEAAGGTASAFFLMYKNINVPNNFWLVSKIAIKKCKEKNSKILNWIKS